MKKHIAAVLLLSLGLAAAASAESREGVLGSQGEVYLTRVGTWSQLFGIGVPADNQVVMGLQILRPGQQPEWTLVPESEGVNPNASRFVLFEDVSETVFVVWEGRIGIHPTIKLASYQDGTWSEVLQVSENVWSWKGFPQLAITRDVFEIGDEAGGTRQVRRTLLHVVWWEETGEGDRTLYRPLVFEDGRFQGMGTILVLNDLLGEELAAGAEAASPALIRHPALQAGTEARSVLVTFADEATGKLAVLEIGLLPAGLSLLAEELHDFVLGLDPEETADGGLESFAGTVRGHITIVGARHRLNPRDVQELAEEVRSRILAAADELSPADLESLAGVVRGHITIVGARISGETMDRFLPSGATSVLRVASDRQPFPAEAGTSHLLRLSLRAELPVPSTDEGDIRIFTSPGGSRVVVAWEVAGARVLYRESTDGGWTEVRTLALGSQLTTAEALEILRQRAGHSF